MCIQTLNILYGNDSRTLMTYNKDRNVIYILRVIGKNRSALYFAQCHCADFSSITHTHGHKKRIISTNVHKHYV